jgi:hypothetical protein
MIYAHYQSPTYCDWNVWYSGTCKVWSWIVSHVQLHPYSFVLGDHCVGFRMVVGFTTTCTCHCAYHHDWSYEFESCSWLGEFDTALCDTVCQRLAKRRWFSPGTPFSSTDIKLTDYAIDIVLNDIIIYWLKIFCSREMFFSNTLPI